MGKKKRGKDRIPKPQPVAATIVEPDSWTWRNKYKIATGLLAAAGGTGLLLNQWSGRVAEPQNTHLRNHESPEEDQARSLSAEVKNIIEENKRAAKAEGKLSLIVMAEGHYDTYCTFLNSEALRHCPTDDVVFETNADTLKKYANAIDMVEEMKQIKATLPQIPNPIDRAEAAKHVAAFEKIGLEKNIGGQAYIYHDLKDKRRIISAASKPSVAEDAARVGLDYNKEMITMIDRDMVDTCKARTKDTVAITGLFHVRALLQDKDLSDKFKITVINVIPRKALDGHMVGTRNDIADAKRHEEQDLPLTDKHKIARDALDRYDFAMNNDSVKRPSFLEQPIKYPFSSHLGARSLSERLGHIQSFSR